MSFSKIAIIGPGLLGGSIALAVRLRARSTHLSVWARKPEAVTSMRSQNLADVVSTELAEVVAGAELIVLCVPIGAMPELARQIAPLIPPDAVITDVGSAKSGVVADLSAAFSERGRFVGSHPMAGSEQSGLAAARADLFERAVCIVTPNSASDPAAIDAVTEFWKLLGCEVRLLSPELHDEAVALVSHLPHLTAAALVHLVASINPDALSLCGNGFRDTTRVASGPPEMWTEIAFTNRVPLQQAIEAMIEKLRELVTLLHADDPQAMNRFLSAAKEQRDRLRR